MLSPMLLSTRPQTTMCLLAHNSSQAGTHLHVLLRALHALQRRGHQAAHRHVAQLHAHAALAAADRQTAAAG
jgi:hypothetical protein